MMTGDQLRRGHDPSRHAAYVGSWIQALRDDPREIYGAAHDAQVMSDYVLDRNREKVPHRETGAATGRERDEPQLVPTVPGQPEHLRHFHREVAGPSRYRVRRQPCLLAVPVQVGPRRALGPKLGLAHYGFTDRLRDMAYVIDRIDLLGYVASSGCMRDAAGMLSGTLSSAGAYHVRDTGHEGCGEPLTLALWESGHDLMIKNGADLEPRLVAGAHVYAAGRLQRQVLEAEGEILCRSEVFCRAADVLVLRGPDGGRQRESPVGRSLYTPISRVPDVGSSA